VKIEGTAEINRSWRQFPALLLWAMCSLKEAKSYRIKSAVAEVLRNVLSRRRADDGGSNVAANRRARKM
jgi:hypothetical protein